MTAAAATLVLQSHRQPLPQPWLDRCLASVRSWAAARGFGYRFEGDELFDRIAPALRQRTAAQPAIAADLGRLAALQAALAEGYHTALWFDADTLVVDASAFDLPEASFALGREVWVQADAAGRPKTYVKVHNAFLMFRAGNPFLDFYRHGAEQIVLEHRDAMAPQLVGPKLLTALHNLIRAPVAERAGMLSPAVTRDLLSGGGPFLDAFRAHSAVAPATVNLCASLTGRELEVCEVEAVIELLLAEPRRLRA